MTTLLAIALTTGLLSGIWGWVAISVGLLSWAGFLGCSTYFASPISGVKGLGISMVTNMSGVLWAMLIIHFSNIFDIELIGYIIIAFISFFMCIQAKVEIFNFIPGTFIGSCAIFASDGNWRLVIPSLLLGAIFGYLMKSSGLWLHKKSNQKNCPLGSKITNELIEQVKE